MPTITENITLLDRPITARHAWTGTSLSEADWFIAIDAACREELLRLLDFTRQYHLPVVLREPAQFPLPHCQALIERVRYILDEGVHHVILDQFPLAEMDAEEAKTLIWIFVSLLARPVPQKWDGTLIYDVRDKGNTYGLGVRASVTNVGLDFHTDCPFNDQVPDYVVLLCLQQAAEGGLSRALSLASVHNILREAYPQHLPRLYQPFYFDRQKEHAPQEPRSRQYPVFRFDSHLSVRCNPTLIRNGYYLAEEAIDEAGEAALTVLQEVLSDESLWWETRLEKGQVQILNNRDLAHTRTAFRDATDPTLQRHLVRYWLRDGGSRFFL